MITLLAAHLAVAPVAFGIPYETYKLEGNGLQVILSEDHELPIVSVNIWYHAGPLNESEKRTGFAHLFEHLMFQGSKHVGDDQHFKMLETAGASMINGTTDFDRTNYFETVPTNQLELSLWLESDRMGFLVDDLTQEKLDNQRAVVMNERRQSVDNRPYGKSDEKMVQTLFPADHPYYGYVIGSMQDLQAASIADVADFFKRYYSPANATLAIVGDFDPTQTKALVARYFGTLAHRDAPGGVSVTTPPVPAERRALVEESVELPRIQIGWLSPAAFQPGDADADVLANILGGGESSRLYRKLVYELELAQNVSAYQESLALTSMFTITVTGRPGVDINKLEDETNKIIEALRAAPPTEREVKRARNQLVTNLVSGLQNVGGFDGKADMLNRYNQYLGDPGYFAKDLARYDSVAPTSVNNIAKSVLARDHRVVVVTIPKKS